MGQLASTISSEMRKTMQESMDKQMAFQQEAFQMQMERQLVMQVQICWNHYKLAFEIKLTE